MADLPANEFVETSKKTLKNKTMINLILTITLIVFAAFMGVKQGLLMMEPRQEVLEMFVKWGLDKAEMNALGTLTLVSGLLIMIPKTFFAGNLLMASVILIIICFQLQQKDLKGFAIELPFLLLNLVLLYLQHPINDLKSK